MRKESSCEKFQRNTAGGVVPEERDSKSCAQTKTPENYPNRALCLS